MGMGIEILMGLVINNMCIYDRYVNEKRLALFK